MWVELGFSGHPALLFDMLMLWIADKHHRCASMVAKCAFHIQKGCLKYCGCGLAESNEIETNYIENIFW